MTIENIKLRPQRIFSHEADFGTSAAQYLWQKMINNHSFVERCFPIGFVLYFYGSQTYANGTRIADPNPEIWALLDGHVVNDPDSPLHGVTLPNVNTFFFKGGTSEFSQGGQPTINLAHSHGGATGVTDDRHPIDEADHGGNYASGSPHFHAISTMWSSVEPIIPPYVDLQMYMRIK